MDPTGIALTLIALSLLAVVGWLLHGRVKLARALQQANATVRQLQEQQQQLAAQSEELQERIGVLAKYQHIIDAENEADSIRQGAGQQLARSRAIAQRVLQVAQQKAISIKQGASRVAMAKAQRTDNLTRHSLARIARALSDAKAEAQQIIATAKADAAQRNQEAEEKLSVALDRSGQLLTDAQSQAEQAASSVQAALQKAETLEATARALQNVIDGYDNAHIAPASSLLDDLAAEFSATTAGKKFRMAREISKHLCNEHRAARCDYADDMQHSAATSFVLDAFNGKVDSILSRIRHENRASLEQQIRDAFALVNHQGAAFGNASISEEYLEARLNELQWAALVLALKERQSEPGVQIP